MNTNPNPTPRMDLGSTRRSFRKQAVWRFLKDHVPGFARSVLTETATQVGVRETRCIEGDHTLTVAEGAANRECASTVS